MSSDTFLLPSVHTGVARALLAEVDLEFFLGALQLPIPESHAYRRDRVELETRRAQKEVAEQQSAQVGELADGVDLKRTEESDGADDHHKVLHLDRDQKTPQDAPVREQDGVGHQYAVDGSRTTDGWYGRIAPRENIVADDYADTGSDSAEEVELQKAPGSPSAFQIGAEHPKRQHVPNDVAKSAMQEHVGG